MVGHREVEVSWSGRRLTSFGFRDRAWRLNDEQADLIAGKFPLTTLDRLLSTPAVRHAIGFELTGTKLQTELPPEEALKPLRRIVLDLAEKKKTVTDLKSKDQQVKYIGELKASDRPNLAKKTGSLMPVERITEKDFAEAPVTAPKKTRAARPAARTSVVPRSCKLNVTTAKIAGIYGELKILQLSKHVHSIGVLLRVFLEMSVDDYLENKAGSTVTFKDSNSGRTLDKKLKDKVKETIAHMVGGDVLLRCAEGAPSRRSYSDYGRSCGTVASKGLMVFPSPLSGTAVGLKVDLTC